MHRKKKNYHFSISEFRIFQTLPSLVFQKLSIHRAQFYFSQRPNTEERFNSIPILLSGKKKKKILHARKIMHRSASISIHRTNSLSKQKQRTNFTQITTSYIAESSLHSFNAPFQIYGLGGKLVESSFSNILAAV